jgi:hypothetical protein
MRATWARSRVAIARGRLGAALTVLGGRMRDRSAAFAEDETAADG